MKLNCKNWMLSTLLLAGLAACSNDDDGVAVGPIIDSGDPTSVKISITQPRTYATNDPNATEVEARLETVDVFIYNASDNLVKQQTLQKEAFVYTGTNSNNSDIYTGDIWISTTTGLKKIYVGVNLPANVRNNIRNYGTIAGVNAVNKIVLDDLIDDGTGKKGFAMFSVEPKSQELKEDSTLNKITIPVSRLVSKITIHETDTLNKTVPGGKIGELTVAMRNSNRLVYALPQWDGLTVLDPNWEDGSYDSDDFQNFSNYRAINAASVTGVDNYKTEYAPENTSEKFYEKETTYASIRAEFIPAQFTKADGTLEDNNSGTVATFWTVRDDNSKISYFSTLADAKAFISANSLNVQPVEYTDGYCYYNMFINPSGKYQMVRNTYYKAKITNISGLGNPKPGEVDPDKPVELKTSLLVTIEILAWEVEEDDYELVP